MRKAVLLAFGGVHLWSPVSYTKSVLLSMSYKAEVLGTARSLLIFMPIAAAIRVNKGDRRISG